jgi:YihY family inner membrane protein
MVPVVSLVARLDRFQRGHAWLGLPLAVIYKFFDDRGPYLAALVTYYSFVSLFPLLLLFYSVAGFVLVHHPDLRATLERSALERFPIIGAKLSHNIAGFRGSGGALVIGVLGTLYGGLGATQAAQFGFNQIYGVPRNEQPNPLKSRLRSLALLALLGSLVLVSTAGAVLLSTANDVSRDLGTALHVAGHVAGFLLNVVVFSAAFQLLTARDLQLRQVVAGGLVAAVAYTLLQSFGAAFVAGRLHGTDALYGVFALVLATLAWLYIQSLILMLAAEINVVRHRRLWPRSLLTPFTDDVELTEADRQAYEMYAATQRFKGFQTVTAHFARHDGDMSGRRRGPPPTGKRTDEAGGDSR